MSARLNPIPEQTQLVVWLSRSRLRLSPILLKPPITIRAKLKNKNYHPHSCTPTTLTLITRNTHFFASIRFWIFFGMGKDGITLQKQASLPSIIVFNCANCCSFRRRGLHFMITYCTSNTAERQSVALQGACVGPKIWVFVKTKRSECIHTYIHTMANDKQ